MNLKRLIVAAVSLSMGLAGVHGGALAQIKEAPIITGNVDGTCVTAPSVNTTGANAGDWTITCGDISPGAGMTVIGPPAVVSDPAPMVAPEPVVEPSTEPEPVAEPAPETTEPVTSDTTVATESDLDADNYPDALEWDLGLDPTNVDTDADGVADGDELNIYGTEPTVADTDGDGIVDGGELFDTRHRSPRLERLQHRGEHPIDGPGGRIRAGTELPATDRERNGDARPEVE